MLKNLIILMLTALVIKQRKRIHDYQYALYMYHKALEPTEHSWLEYVVEVDDD